MYFHHYLKSVFLIQGVYKRIVGEQAGLSVSASLQNLLPRLLPPPSAV